VAAEGRGQPGNVPQLERAVPRRTKWAKINRVSSKIKLLKSPENNFDIDIFINPKYNIKILNIDSKNSFHCCQNGSLENVGISRRVVPPVMTYNLASHWLSFSLAVGFKDVCCD